MSRAGPGTDPSNWTTEGGTPLTEKELAIVRSATPEDAQAVHDLCVLDAKAAGFKVNCRRRPCLPRRPRARSTLSAGMFRPTHRDVRNVDHRVH